MEIEKRNLILLALLYIGSFLLPFFFVEKENLTQDRILLASAVSLAIYASELVFLFAIFKLYGYEKSEILKILWRFLGVRDRDFANFVEKERKLFNIFVYTIIGFPTMALILSGSILEFGSPVVAFKFLFAFLGFMIPLIQISIYPLVLVFFTYYIFVKKQLPKGFSGYWIKVTTIGLFSLLLSLALIDEPEKEKIKLFYNISKYQDLLLFASLLNIFLSSLKYLIEKTKALSKLTISVYYFFGASSIVLLLNFINPMLFSERIPAVAISSILILIFALFLIILVLQKYGHSIESTKKVSIDLKSGSENIRNVIFLVLSLFIAFLSFAIAFSVGILQIDAETFLREAFKGLKAGLIVTAFVLAPFLFLAFRKFRS